MRLVLRSFGHQLDQAHVLVRMGNMTTKAYLNLQGGTRSKSLMREEALLLQWAENHLASIKAEYLAGISNLTADWLSRQSLSKGEWSLHPSGPST